MRPGVDAFIVLAGVFGAGLLGLSLRSVLPERHLQEDSLGMHSQYASLQLLEADGDKGDVLRLLAHRGFHPRSALHWQRVYVEATTTCGVALRTRKRFTIPDIEPWEGIKGSLDEEAYRGSGIRSVQSTPLFSRTGALLGMISTHWSHPYRPTDGELRAFDILARQVADFLEATEPTEAERQ